MSGIDRRKANRPLFIYWQFPSARTPTGEIPGCTVTRKSDRYIRFADFLANNPPNITPFKPGDIPVKYMTLHEYRKDVMNWLSRQMIISLQFRDGLDEEEKFSNAIGALHDLPWSPGSPRRGFYLVMPNPKEIRAVRRDDFWGLRALGRPDISYFKAKGLGTWAEPDFKKMEIWEARKAILGLLNTFENLAQAALTGRKVAQLEPQQIRVFLQNMTQDLRRALPEPKDE